MEADEFQIYPNMLAQCIILSDERWFLAQHSESKFTSFEDIRKNSRLLKEYICSYEHVCDCQGMLFIHGSSQGTSPMPIGDKYKAVPVLSNQFL